MAPQAKAQTLEQRVNNIETWLKWLLRASGVTLARSQEIVKRERYDIQYVRGSKWLRLAASVLNSESSPVDVVGVLACLWVASSLRTYLPSLAVDRKPV
jgi:hypothetical protein